MTYRQARLKFQVEYLLILPFVLAGRLYGILFPLKTKHNIFLFFPNADIGGSPQVNIDLTNCLKDQKPLIIFSKKPKNNGFRQLFNIEEVRVLDLHHLIDRKFIHFLNFFYRGVLASWITKSDNPIIIGGESLFFYKMLQHLPRRAKRIEICHLNTWLPYSIGHIDRISTRIFSTIYLKKEVEKQYKENHLPDNLYNCLYFIDNSIEIPEAANKKNKLLEAVFIGRGAPQKRIHLVASIAQKMYEANEPIHFSFVGDVEKSIDITRYTYCKFHGNISDQVILEEIYSNADVLILTSAFEGLPIVVMKMMAYGKVVVSTAVNGIPDYIEHKENGLLIYGNSEDEIINEGAELLRLLIKSPDLRETLGKKSREKAIQKFSKATFCNHYKKVIFS